MALAHVCIRVMWCAIHDICAKAECERRSPSMIQRVRSAMRWMHTLSLSSPFAPSNPTHIDAQLSHKSGARRRIAVRSSSPSQQRLEIQKNALDRRSRGKHPCSKARQRVSGILRYYWDALKVSTAFLSGVWASPLPTFSAQILA